MKKIHPKVKMHDTNYNLEKAINNSKISIFFYLATPFLTNISLNKPSIFIFPNNFEEMIEDKYLDIFKKMEDVNIIVKSPAELANFLNKKYSDIENWWYNDKTQTIRKEVSRLFAKKNNDSLNILINSLIKG